MKKPAGKPFVAPAKPVKNDIDLSVVAALAKIATEHDLSEVVVEHAGLHIRVARERRAAVATNYTVAAPTAAPVAAATAAPIIVEPIDRADAVNSPMVGTAYLRPSPEAKPFIEIGSTVKAGEKILLVEAMKTFNEIVAPRAGKVTHIFVEDGSPVEYGQPLLVIE
jgi:acetyl-CoA carboxylase biotin carboxyl carrier protein